VMSGSRRGSWRKNRRMISEKFENADL
jgi:hypothetical protein